MSGPFASATEIPILAVKQTLASDIKKRCIRNCNLNAEACGKKMVGSMKKSIAAVFLFARPSLIKLKKMVAGDAFFIVV